MEFLHGNFKYCPLAGRVRSGDFTIFASSMISHEPLYVNKEPDGSSYHLSFQARRSHRSAWQVRRFRLFQDIVRFFRDNILLFPTRRRGPIFGRI
jgi:hypothetical protein